MPSTPTNLDAQLATGVTIPITYRHSDFFLSRGTLKNDLTVLAGWTILATIFLVYASVTPTQPAAALPSRAPYFQVTLLWLIPGTLFVLLLLLNRRLRERKHRQQWDRQNANPTCRITLTSTGVLTETPTGTNNSPWTDFYDYEENTYGFWLFPENAPDQPRLIPARSIRRDQVPLARELLRRHASPSKGFPVTLSSSQPSTTPPRKP